MKILYISPENTVGTLNLWQEAHEARGNKCTFITLYNSQHKFDPGVCLNLPLISVNQFYFLGRHYYYKLARGENGDYKNRDGYPPTWKANSLVEQLYFNFRDWVWHFKIESIIKEMKLFDYDIYHLEWGLEFYRDGRFVKKLKKLNKPVICTYHGQDLRSRGVIPTINQASDLNLTSELDLLEKHPNLKYLFLPFNTSTHNPSYKINKKIRICHSPTNRYYKGSETIIPICEKLSKKYDIEFILIENKSHREAQCIKQSCDIFIDQIHNRGGWGYGMNSVEALSMGLCCVTELVPQYKAFIPDHPFVSVNAETLNKTLEELLNNRERILEYKKRAREWVIKYHDINNTSKMLYDYYRKIKII